MAVLMHSAAADHVQQHAAQAGAAGWRAGNTVAQPLQPWYFRTGPQRRHCRETQMSAFNRSRLLCVHLQQQAPVVRQQQQQLAGGRRFQLRHGGHVVTALGAPQLQPDPAADDLDMLVAQTAPVAPSINHARSTSSGMLAVLAPSANADRQSTRKFAANALAVSAAQPSMTAATSAIVKQQQQARYTAADKLWLTEAEAKDIARRLRTPWAPRPGEPVLRMFRYGIDDLRLYKAINAAGLEGRVIVVDTVDFADLVLTTVKKRTGKNVNQAMAKRAAAGAGVPCFVLKAVSAERLVEALDPMLGSQHAEALSSEMEASMQQSPTHQHPAALEAAARAAAPRQLRQEEVEDDSSEQLLQLLWGLGAATEAAGPEVDEGHSSRIQLPYGPRWQAWHVGQLGKTVDELFDLVRQIDIEDSRDHMVPVNPNARAGARYELMKPLRHNSKLRKKLLNKDLAAKNAHW